MGDDSWSDYIKQCCIGQHCWAAGVLYTETGEIFDVAADDDDGWTHLYSDPFEAEIDGKKRTINESEILTKILESGRSEVGLWLAQNKYHIIRTDVMPFKDDKEYQVTFFAKGKIGGVLVKGDSYSVIGLYNEEKEQTKNGCLGVILEFCHIIRAY